ncbi:MAG: threonine--tRNA ligase [Deltaproteobacteria bacterium]
MIEVFLPDGSSRQLPEGATGLDLANSIGRRLAQDAVAVRINEQLSDIYLELPNQAQIEIITRTQPDGVELLRHDAAHVMAQAVKELYPETQVTIGPVIENGFYYDFAREESFTPDDLERIEGRMRELVKEDISIQREVWERDVAITFFEEQGETYKAQIIRDLPEDEVISLYRQGEFIDLCRGPHLPSTGRLGQGFKLMKLAGAYWRGKSENAMLQRIYGTAWSNEKELNGYLHQLEEAERRDHRRLGREMGLFHFQDEALGSVFWHPKGWTLYRICEQYMRQRLEKAGYVEIKTPQLMDRSLWEKSGHWGKFQEHMFIAEVDEGGKGHSEDQRSLALKPMSCPGHVEIFRQGIKSYRDLPLRLAEFGSCHRYEPHGALHGLMRVRAFTQDDAHIFCTEGQIEGETKAFIELLSTIYQDFGFESFHVKFSDRPEVRAGSDEIWDRAESALLAATKAAGQDYTLNPGEGAFYGPKLEFVLRDAIGRDWQCGTLQVDFVLPERLDASYVAEDGQRYRPVMLHRAILGSFERFLGILVEQFAGRFPLWLAPTQAVLATIVTEANDYALDLQNQLLAAGLRAEVDLRNEKISYKVREHSLQKVPVLLALGRREAEEKTVTVRRLGSKEQQTLLFEDFLVQLQAEATPPALR